MIIDFLAKFPAVIAALVGAFVAIPTWWTSYSTQRRQATKSELDALLAAADRAGDDEPYKQFLLGLYKEKLISLAFGCSIALDQVGGVMHLRAKGNLTAEEIGTAWPYRDAATPTPSFRFSTARWMWYGAVNLYVYVCWFVSSLMLGTMLLPIGIVRWQLAAQSVCFAVLSIGAAWMHRGLYAARRLEKLSKHQRALTIQGMAGRLGSSGS